LSGRQSVNTGLSTVQTEIALVSRVNLMALVACPRVIFTGHVRGSDITLEVTLTDTGLTSGPIASSALELQ